MPIQFQCPTCGSQLEVAETHAGTVKRCPQCNELVRIPHGSAPVTAEAKSPAPPPAQREVRDLKEPKAGTVPPTAGPKREETKQPEPKSEAELPETKVSPEIAAIELLTTDALIKPGFRITKTFPLLRAHRVAGAKFFRDLFVAVRDTTGGISQAAEKLFDEIEIEVLTDLQRKAFELGANAVIGVRIQSIDVSGKSEMFYVTAQGTPIAIERAP